jgi:peptidoglycan/LPS O-acetylase OafA/YrhL
VTHGIFGMVRSVGFGAGAFLIIIGALNVVLPDKPGGTVLRRLATSIGDASFVIYLTHNLILQALAIVTRRLPAGAVMMGVEILMAMTLIAMVGLLLHRWIEQPWIRYAQRSVIPALLRRQKTESMVAGRRKVK